MVYIVGEVLHHTRVQVVEQRIDRQVAAERIRFGVAKCLHAILPHRLTARWHIRRTRCSRLGMALASERCTASQVLMQTWQGRPQSWCRRGRGVPFRGYANRPRRPRSEDSQSPGRFPSPITSHVTQSITCCAPLCLFQGSRRRHRRRRRPRKDQPPRHCRSTERMAEDELQAKMLRVRACVEGTGGWGSARAGTLGAYPHGCRLQMLGLLRVRLHDAEPTRKLRLPRSLAPTREITLPERIIAWKPLTPSVEVRTERYSFTLSANSRPITLSRAISMS